MPLAKVPIQPMTFPPFIYRKSAMSAPTSYKRESASKILWLWCRYHGYFIVRPATGSEEYTSGFRRGWRNLPMYQERSQCLLLDQDKPKG